MNNRLGSIFAWVIYLLAATMLAPEFAKFLLVMLGGLGAYLLTLTTLTKKH